MLHHSENGVPFEIYVDARSYVRLLDDLLGISYLSDAEKLRKLVFPSEFSRPLSSMRDLLVALRPIFVFVSLFSFEDNSRMMQNKVEAVCRPSRFIATLTSAFCLAVQSASFPGPGDVSRKQVKKLAQRVSENKSTFWLQPQHVVLPLV